MSLEILTSLQNMVGKKVKFGLRIADLETCISPNMTGVIVKYFYDHQDPFGSSGVLVNISDPANKPLQNSDYYGDTKTSRLTATEAGFWEDEVWVHFKIDENVYFKIQEN